MTEDSEVLKAAFQNVTPVTGACDTPNCANRVGENNLMIGFLEPNFGGDGRPREAQRPRSGEASSSMLFAATRRFPRLVFI